MRWAALPEYPHYTRPADYRGWSVPEVLLSGHHANIESWRLEQSRLRGELERDASDEPSAPRSATIGRRALFSCASFSVRL